MTETTGAREVPWQPEPFGVPGSGYIHPSLNEFQRGGAFYLDPTPPPDGARMVKGPAYHAPCGNPISTKFLDDGTFGEYGCRECNERGYLLRPGLAPRAERPVPHGPTI